MCQGLSADTNGMLEILTANALRQENWLNFRILYISKQHSASIDLLHTEISLANWYYSELMMTAVMSVFAKWQVIHQKTFILNYHGVISSLQQCHRFLSSSCGFLREVTCHLTIENSTAIGTPVRFSSWCKGLQQYEMKQDESELSHEVN